MAHIAADRHREAAEVLHAVAKSHEDAATAHDAGDHDAAKAHALEAKNKLAEAYTSAYAAHTETETAPAPVEEQAQGA